VKTSLTARQLLDSCLGIERKLGRVRPADGAKRSRVIDIDVLLFGEQTIDEPGLQVPHPALLTRPSCASHWPMSQPRAKPSPGGERLDTSTPTPACGACLPRSLREGAAYLVNQPEHRPTP